MTEEVGKAVIAFQGDTGNVGEALEQLQFLFKKCFSGILSNFVGPLSGALAAGKLFGEFTRSADKISKFSKAVGISGEDLQAWGEAATRAGGSSQAFQGTIRSLQRRISMASSGAGAGAKTFQKFGISLKDSNGKAKDSFQILSELAEKADTMSNADFMGMAQQLRIDQGTIQLLQKGSKGVAELVERQRQLGVYTEEDYEAAENYNDAMADFKQATQVASARIFSVLLPPLNAFVFTISKVVAVITKNRALLRGAAFASMALVIVTKVVPALKKLKNAASLKNFGTWAKLAAVFTTLYLVVEDFVVWLQGGKSALAGLWEKFGTADEVKEKLKKLQESVGKMLGVLSDFGPILGVVTLAFSTFGTAVAVASGVSKATKRLSEFAETSKTIAPALKWVKTFGKDLGGFVMSNLKNFGSYLKDTALPAVLSFTKGLLVSGLSALKSFATYMITTAIPAAWGFTTALLANPVTWVVLGIVALIAALAAVVYYWDDIKAAAQKCWIWLKDAWGGFSDWFSGIWNQITEAAKNLWDGLTSAAQECWSRIKDTWGGFEDWFLGIWDRIKTALFGWWNSIIDFFIEGWRGFIDGLLDHVPNFVKKWFMKDDESDEEKQRQTEAYNDGTADARQSAELMMRGRPSSSYAGMSDDEREELNRKVAEGLKYYDPRMSVYGSARAAVEGLDGRIIGNSTSNDVEVTFNVAADDPDDLAMQVQRKQRSNGFLSRIFGGNNDADDAYQLQTGTIGP